MSIISQKDHGESIYDLLRPEPHARPKSPLYISKVEKELKRLHSSAPKTHSTMGYPSVPLRGSDLFLKKGEGIYAYSKEQKKKCLNSGKLPSLPKKDPNYPTNPKKLDFEARNKKMADEMMIGGMKESPVVVDSSNGHTSSVYKFKRVYSKSFGTVPKYLARRIEDIQKEEKHYRAALENDEPLCKPISQEERQQLLNGLKQNWAKKQKEFLLLPVLIDTVPKVIRKTKLEATLRQLESDIRAIEESPHIYIYD